MVKLSQQLNEVLSQFRIGAPAPEPPQLQVAGAQR
jgi:hypothetical protein